jgi:hypothetical protein
MDIAKKYVLFSGYTGKKSAKKHFFPVASGHRVRRSAKPPAE